MADSSIYREYYEAVMRCSRAAQADFAKVLALIDLDDIETARLMLLELLPGIVAKYGDAAATAAAELYEAVLYSETGKRVTAYLAATDQEKVRSAVEKAFSKVAKEGKPHNAVPLLQKYLDHYVKEPARSTITESAKRDGVRYARVPTGRETCGWCIMLASRGFVYHSEQTAHGYHTNCDCLPVPSTKADTVLEGYDQQKYEDMYLDARKKVIQEVGQSAWDWLESERKTELVANQLRNDLYEQNKDHVNEVKRQWWAENKDEQNAKRRKKAAERRKKAAAQKG